MSRKERSDCAFAQADLNLRRHTCHKIYFSRYGLYGKANYETKEFPICLHLQNITAPQREKKSLQTCAPSEDSDQPMHSHSLIRIFTRRILDSQGCQVSSCEQRRLRSACADAQADFSLRWVHMSEGMFSQIT